MFLMNPYDHRCCQHNVGQGWPYLAEHLWMATPDDGLACMFPLESIVKAKVADGSEVTLAISTHYPFDSTIEIKVTTPRPLAFPLYVRIPGWCDRPTVSINRKLETIPGAKPLSYVRIDREWTTGDSVALVCRWRSACGPGRRTTVPYRSIEVRSRILWPSVSSIFAPAGPIAGQPGRSGRRPRGIMVWCSTPMARPPRSRS